MAQPVALQWRQVTPDSWTAATNGTPNLLFVSQPDGTYRIHGTKIYISGGDHDLTDRLELDVRWYDTDAGVPTETYDSALVAAINVYF